MLFMFVLLELLGQDFWGQLVSALWCIGWSGSTGIGKSAPNVAPSVAIFWVLHWRYWPDRWFSSLLPGTRLGWGFLPHGHWVLKGSGKVLMCQCLSILG